MDYENICIECSKPFVTTDKDMNYCPDCWAAAINMEDCMEVKEEKEDDNE